jgi:alpha-1,3-glucosyltransferase
LLAQIFKRVFPVNRGLYEDKVANFWCAISIVIKIRNLLPLDKLLLLSFVTTLCAVLPCSVYLLRRATPSRLLYSLAISSLGFFLFSFQVHEKAIMLPALCITLLSNVEPMLSLWFNNVAIFSLYPLLKRDGLQLQYVAVVVLYNSLNQSTLYKSNILVKLSLAVMVLAHLSEVIAAPTRYPDIHVMLFVTVSFGQLFLAFAYLNWVLFKTKEKIE